MLPSLLGVIAGLMLGLRRLIAGFVQDRLHYYRGPLRQSLGGSAGAVRAKVDSATAKGPRIKYYVRVSGGRFGQCNCLKYLDTTVCPTLTVVLDRSGTGIVQYIKATPLPKPSVICIPTQLGWALFHGLLCLPKNRKTGKIDNNLLLKSFKLGFITQPRTMYNKVVHLL